MGLHVTAEQAAWLVGHGERMVRWHIQPPPKGKGDLPATKDRRTWRIDVDALEAIPGWTVNRNRLAELEAAEQRTAASMVARIAELERQVRDFRARLARLEAASASGAQAARSEGQETASAGEGAMSTYSLDDTEAGGRYGALHRLSPDARGIESDYPSSGGYRSQTSAYQATYRGPRTVSLADRGGGPLRFKTKMDGSRWLARHGINERTPKTWPGWPPLDNTPAGVFADALARQRAAKASHDWRVTWELHACSDEACVCRELLVERVE
jgi:hypothetical protein